MSMDRSMAGVMVAALLIAAGVSGTWARAAIGGDEPFILGGSAGENRAEPAASDSMRADPFAEGSRMVTAYGSTTLLDDDHGNFFTGHLGVHYYFEDDLSIGLEGVGGYVEPNWTSLERPEPDEDGIVGGLDLMLRQHFVTRRDWSLYLDGGVGAQQASTDFPSDTRFNFRVQLGIGATWRVFDDAMLMGGVRYHHQSNASISDNNDGGDWAQPYIGVMVPF